MHNRIWRKPTPLSGSKDFQPSWSVLGFPVLPALSYEEGLLRNVVFKRRKAVIRRMVVLQSRTFYLSWPILLYLLWSTTEFLTQSRHLMSWEVLGQIPAVEQAAFYVPGSVPFGVALRDPEHLGLDVINQIYDGWLQRQAEEKVPFAWVSVPYTIVPVTARGTVDDLLARRQAEALQYPQGRTAFPEPPSGPIGVARPTVQLEANERLSDVDDDSGMDRGLDESQSPETQLFTLAAVEDASDIRTPFAIANHAPIWPLIEMFNHPFFGPLEDMTHSSAMPTMQNLLTEAAEVRLPLSAERNEEEDEPFILPVFEPPPEDVEMANSTSLKLGSPSDPSLGDEEDEVFVLPVFEPPPDDAEMDEPEHISGASPEFTEIAPLSLDGISQASTAPLVLSTIPEHGAEITTQPCIPEIPSSALISLRTSLSSQRFQTPSRERQDSDHGITNHDLRVDAPAAPPEPTLVDGLPVIRTTRARKVRTPKSRLPQEVVAPSPSKPAVPRPRRKNPTLMLPDDDERFLVGRRPGSLQKK